MSSVPLQGEAQDVALAETQAVLVMARDDDYRGRLASLRAAATEGEVAGEDAETLQELLELGLQSGRLRALAGQELRSVSLEAIGPGAFSLSLAAGSAEITVRLDRQGARLHSVGVGA